MKVFNNFNISKNFKRSCIAIGNFDGVHKGHQKVFSQAKKFSKRYNAKLGVMTFDPLPVIFFKKNLKNYKLTSNNQKFNLLKKYGINFVLNIKFNKIFSMIKAEKFIKNIIYKKVNPKLIFVSNNFKFGNKREGDINLLKDFSKKYDFKVINVNPFKYNGKIISSTRIRKNLQKGEINLANKLLSRTWFVEGEVIQGKKIGRKLGYRTCNMEIKDYILPRFGIYSVKILIGKENRLYNGISYLGSRPTFRGKKTFLETNIFGIKKNLYKKRLKVFFLKFIRRDKKFRNSKELIKQMNKDVNFVKKGLKAKLVL